ncbi:hypothetical protein L3Q67_02510 [Saccharothrix sp. AJ9571]|nr:hypothetical protein L3Q67_02510 [Saccharothrix sp. AJ9571]
MARVRTREDAELGRDQARVERGREKRERDNRARAADVECPSGAGEAGVVPSYSDVLAMDYDQVIAAETALARHYDHLSSFLPGAQQLGARLQDGSSPVTRPMRQAFGLRGGAAPGGVQASLQGYLAELASLRHTLAGVRAAHEEHDQSAAAGLRRAAAEQRT